MSKLSEVNERITISLSRENYEKLRRLGMTPDSFNDIVERLLANVKEENQ